MTLLLGLVRTICSKVNRSLRSFPFAKATNSPGLNRKNISALRLETSFFPLVILLSKPRPLLLLMLWVGFLMISKKIRNIWWCSCSRPNSPSIYRFCTISYSGNRPITRSGIPLKKMPLPATDDIEPRFEIIENGNDNLAQRNRWRKTPFCFRNEWHNFHVFNYLFSITLALI